MTLSDVRPLCILAAREAFEMLRQRARGTNGPVIDLARHVVEIRGL